MFHCLSRTKIIDRKVDCYRSIVFHQVVQVKDISFRFPNNTSKKTDTVKILFKMPIDTSITSIPFIAVESIGENDAEREILFFYARGALF